MRILFIAFSLLMVIALHAQQFRAISLQDCPKLIYDMEYSIDGQFLAATDGKGIGLWQSETGLFERKIATEFDSVYSICFSKDGRMLYFSAGKIIVEWNLAESRAERMFEGGSGMIAIIAASPDNRWIVAGGKDGTITTWNVDSGKFHSQFIAHKKPITSLAVSMNSQFLISAGGDQYVEVWDIPSKKLHKTLSGHSNRVRGLAVDPNGMSFVSCGDDRKLFFWNIADTAARKPIYSLEKSHSRGVMDVTYNAFGYLATVGRDDKLILYTPNKPDFPSRKFRVDTLRGLNHSELNKLRFNPKTSQLAVSSLGGGIFVENYYKYWFVRAHTFEVTRINGKPAGKELKSDDQNVSFECVISGRGDIYSLSIQNTSDKKITRFTTFPSDTIRFESKLSRPSTMFLVIIKDNDTSVHEVKTGFDVVLEKKK